MTIQNNYKNMNYDPRIKCDFVPFLSGKEHNQTIYNLFSTFTITFSRILLNIILLFIMFLCININANDISHGKGAIFADGNVDIIVITVDTLLKHAEKYAVWERQKGYDVKILSRKKRWVADDDGVTAIEKIYNDAIVKPSYVTIIGSATHIQHLFKPN